MVGYNDNINEAKMSVEFTGTPDHSDPFPWIRKLYEQRFEAEKKAIHASAFSGTLLIAILMFIFGFVVRGWVSFH